VLNIVPRLPLILREAKYLVIYGANLWCQYRFRQSVRNGTYASDLLRYRSPLFPWTARFVIITNFAIMVGTWFSEQGVVIMLVELAFMIGILLSWYLFRPTLSRLRNTVG
ncbi:hypothetical protein L2E10_17295, partial [Salmonella enterica subsp. enterica serovar Weltevreden]|nr:hypothetical protein [Salmonella enterica subsp. enterica serovar Weltevreden]